MPNKITFTAEPRVIKGKKVKKLRSEDVVPGNVYGVGKESQAIKFNGLKFIKLYEEVGETSVVYLHLGEQQKPLPVLIDEVQVDPVSGEYLHVSFKQVDLSQTIEAEIPVEVIGEFDVPEAVMVQVRNTIMVEALPTDLPEHFEVDISGLEEIGQMITLQDLKFDKDKVTIVEIEVEEDWEKPVVLVQEQREEEVEEEVNPEDVVVGEDEEAAEGEESPAQSSQEAPQTAETSETE